MLASRRSSGAHYISEPHLSLPHISVPLLANTSPHRTTLYPRFRSASLGAVGRALPNPPSTPNIHLPGSQKLPGSFDGHSEASRETKRNPKGGQREGNATWRYADRRVQPSRTALNGKDVRRRPSITIVSKVFLRKSSTSAKKTGIVQRSNDLATWASRG